MNEIIIYLICGISLVVALGIWTIPELHYKYKEELLKEKTLLNIEVEKTKRESIILAQKVAEKDKEAEKTKQLQIKADYEEKYRKTLYSV